MSACLSAVSRNEMCVYKKEIADVQAYTKHFLEVKGLKWAKHRLDVCAFPPMWHYLPAPMCVCACLFVLYSLWLCYGHVYIDQNASMLSTRL
jgi:hypothetical protein